MIWQRVMSYANQNVKIRPIPGLPDPLPDPRIVGQLAKAGKKDGETATPERPPILSSATTELLRQLSETLKTAPALKPQAHPETLSSL
jgi:penicillin-binding protein 1A